MTVNSVVTNEIMLVLSLLMLVLSLLCLCVEISEVFEVFVAVPVQLKGSRSLYLSMMN